MYKVYKVAVRIDYCGKDCVHEIGREAIGRFMHRSGRDRISFRRRNRNLPDGRKPLTSARLYREADP